jgi:hypothetical protein
MRFRINLNVAEKFPQLAAIGKPFGKASGRTFRRINAYVPDPSWSLLLVTSPYSLKMSNRPPFEALKSGLPMAVSWVKNYSFGVEKSTRIIDYHFKGYMKKEF